MPKIIQITIIIAIVVSGCNSSNTTTIPPTFNTSPNDTSILSVNEYAKLISAQNSDYFSNIQAKKFYKNYQKSITTTWNYFYLNQLMVIKNWSEKHKITDSNDTIPVFYPFSGPDFPFPFAFFPYAKNYIMVGLENIGKVPNFRNYTDWEIEQYLNTLAGSMTNFFLEGYFNTKTMKKNFRSDDINGIIHPLIFFIKITKHSIINYKYFILNDFGRITYVNSFKPLDNEIKGIHIKFSDDKILKNLYYLQIDLSNNNILDHNEFITFISNLGKKNVFLKSASYLLFEEKLSLFKKILNNQALKILQDDSGFDYKYLTENNYTISLFGNYKNTLNIFSKYKQPELKNKYNDIKSGKLPFRFGYNIPFDQMTIIFAKKDEEQKKQYPLYTVQFRISWEKLSADSFPENIENINYYFDEGYYKYTSGMFSKQEKAREHLKKIKADGYRDAFIVLFDSAGKKIIKSTEPTNK